MSQPGQELTSDTTRRHILAFVARFATVSFIGAAYTTLFWGRAPALLPAPFSSWSDLVHPHVIALRGTSPLTWLAIHLTVGLVVPLGVTVATRRKLRNVGIAWPNRLGWFMTGIAVVISIPFGFWLANSSNFDLPRPQLFYWCSMLALIPEHVLICGVYAALLMPRGRFPEEREMLARFGITAGMLPGVFMAGLLFGLVHVGKGVPLEIALSFPGGAFITYLTIRSRSVLPAIIAHWTLNLAPLIASAISQHIISTHQ